MPERVGAEELPLTTHEHVRYVVHLPVFEGPLDLLLHLIEKRQMEVTTISLVAVTDQYLAYLQQWEAESRPLANMAAFVSIAARLLFIKSQSLLPQNLGEEAHSETETATEVAEELQRHLVEYRLTKEIASLLRRREEAGLQTQLTWTPPMLAGLEVQSLARAFQRLLELKARDVESSTDLLPVVQVRVSERIARIMSCLQEQPSISLAEVIENEQSRLVIIVTFLAVLELWKWQRINVMQEVLLGPIILERGERWAAEGKEDIED